MGSKPRVGGRGKKLIRLAWRAFKLNALASHNTLYDDKGKRYNREELMKVIGAYADSFRLAKYFRAGLITVTLDEYQRHQKKLDMVEFIISIQDAE